MSALLAALAYGVLSLDHFTVGPFLLSRPLVLGSLVGCVCGHPGEGVALGLLAESLWVMVPPVGGGQWDVGLAVALAGVWAFEWPHDIPVPGGRIALAFLLAIPFSVVGRRVDQWARRHLRLLAVRALAGIERGLVGPLRYSLVFGAVLWGIKSVVIFFIADSLGGAVFNSLVPRIVGFWAEGFERTWSLWPALGAAALLNQFSRRLGKNRLWIPGGL
ncbi:MAG: PTS sugar transporter subunit IIC [Elusimicrobia bacterium]|nr:PTS sugar transporter subunit IIC [Elusimicrobiota bacterium]